MNEPIIYGLNWAAVDESDSEQTHVVEWVIFEVFGIDTETGKTNFIKAPGSQGGADEPVEDIADATRWASLMVKWDSCSHLNLLDEGYFHVCGYDTWQAFNDMMTDLFRRSRDKMAATEANVQYGNWPE